MWPGQQPGGEQHPQQPNPYQQPQAPYGQQQPQQYNPYAQQPPTPPQWGPAMQPGGPVPPQKPPSSGMRPGAIAAIVIAVAVLAAGVVVGVVLVNKDDDGGSGTAAKKSPSPSPSPSSPDTANPRDNPRGGGVEPVIKGWQAIPNTKRHDIFDVPPDWKVLSSGTLIGFEDSHAKVKKGDLGPPPLVTMRSPAYYKEHWCKVKGKDGYPDEYSMAGVGTKGGVGAKNTKEAAENESRTWAYAAFDQDKTGTFKTTPTKTFSSKYGIKGHFSKTTVTGVKKENKCDSDGAAYAVTYTDKEGEFATWVLYTKVGVDDAVPESTVLKIMSTLRPLK